MGMKSKSVIYAIKLIGVGGGNATAVEPSLDRKPTIANNRPLANAPKTEGHSKILSACLFDPVGCRQICSNVKKV
jgi:hypothetical protein